MAAVVGSVADEILQAMLKQRDLLTACVNSGGDIALPPDARLAAPAARRAAG